jgi:hypothetical protein
MGSVSKKTKSKSETGTLKKTAKAAGIPGQKRSTAPKATKPSASRKAKSRTGKDQDRIIEEFRSVVNISRDQFEHWLGTPESRKLRFPDEPKGGMIASQAILKLLTKKHDKITREDVGQMQAIIEFIEDRIQKRPKGDIVASNWRYALMNWGHDPSKPLKRVRGKQNEK